jgi:hypothetical protein
VVITGALVSVIITLAVANLVVFGKVFALVE